MKTNDDELQGLSDAEIDEFADAIVIALFQNGAGEQGAQLRIFNHTGFDAAYLGGWSRAGARSQIVKVLSGEQEKNNS